MTEAGDEPASRGKPRSWMAGYQGNRILTGYVMLVVGLGVGLLALEGVPGPHLLWHFLLWFLFCLVAELLWLETPTGEGTDSMSSTFNVVVLYLYGNGLSLWIIGLSVLFATRYIQRRDWVHSLFGLGQMVVTAYAAGWVFLWLAGGPGEIEHFKSAHGLAAFVLCSVLYFILNTFLVSGAVALEKRLPLWSTWKTNYGYRNSITSSATLFALSPILLLSFMAIGYMGVFLFFLPLVIVKNQNRAYIDLKRAQERLIASERMAAKGEMAASIAHEMNNYLAVLSARMELLKRRLAKLVEPELTRDAEIIWTQIGRLTTQADGLTRFSNVEVVFGPFDLNDLCRSTVEFMKPQNLFDPVRFEMNFAKDLGQVTGDPGQIQQILMNLFRNAAQAMRDAKTEEPALWVHTGLKSDGKEYVQLVVEDNGPGVPQSLKARIFDPGFTTKADGHGFGLATCLRIMEAHGGRLQIEDRTGGGARFIASWPHKRVAERPAMAA